MHDITVIEALRVHHCAITLITKPTVHLIERLLSHQRLPVKQLNQLSP